VRRSVDRILTTHVGSLPRPDAVVGVVLRAEAGEPPGPEELAGVVGPAIADVVRRQLDAGLDVVNDGEQSKFSFTSYHTSRLGGFSALDAPPVAGMEEMAEADEYPRFFERMRAYSTSTAPRPRVRGVCTGPVGYEGLAELEQDIAWTRQATEGTGAAEVFMTAISPATLARITPNEHYPTKEELEEAIAESMRVEYEAIVAAGLLLQIDCPDFGVTTRYTGASLEEHRRQVARNVELLNHATRNIDPDRMRFHVCWGADEAPHHLDVPLPAMLDLLLEARPHGMTIVGANGRHAWEWRVWEDVELPDGKVVVPGVIDSTTNIVEHPATVAERIVRYAGVLGRENVIAGVDCGLDTVAGVRQVDPAIAWAKLASLAEGARLASARLWP
jgi:5-methyltetrahydropteroyltriglutamate--homocysteine methyltransferase